MARKKNLERAIILGLILSTGVYGSAWAEETITGPIVDDTYNNEVFNKDVIINGGNESAIEIGSDTVSITTQEPIEMEKENGTIKLNSDKYGIRLKGSGLVTLNAVGDNVITVTVDNTSADIGDGINVTEDAAGTITLNGGNNTITVTGEHSDGIYTATDNNTIIEMNANSGDNTINADNNGIDHRGDNTITLKAENGSNIIKTTAGDGIRVEGTGTVEFIAQNNEITAGDNGIQVEGGGSVNITANSGNIINAVYNGVYANGKDSIVNMNGKNNKIIVDDSNIKVHSSGIYTNGIHVADGADYIIEKNDGNDVLIDVTASTYKANGILAENNSTVDIDTNNFTLDIKGDVKESATNDSNIYGVYSDQSNVDINASDSVNITVNNYGGNEDIANGYGIRAVYGHTTSSDIITDFENTYLKIVGSDITINSTVHKGMSFPGAVGLSAEAGVGNYYSDNNKKVIVNVIATGENGIDIKAQSAGVANGIQVSDNSEVTIKADRGNVNISAIGSEGTSNDAIYVNSSTISDSKYDLKTQVHVSGINNNVTATGAGTAVRAEYGKSFIDVTANGGNNIVKSDNTAVYSAYGANINLEAEQGINNISGKTGVYAVSGLVDLNAINNIVKSNNYGLYAHYANSNIDLNSVDENNIETDGESGYAICSDGENTIVTVNSTKGNNKIVSKYRGILAQDSSDVNITAIIGNNVINADDYAIFSSDSSDVRLTAGLNSIVSGKTYGIAVSNASTNLEAGKSNIVNSENKAIYAYTNANVDLDADVFNKLYAGELAYYDAENGGGIYGNKRAIDARSGSTVTLDAGNANAISGAVYASGKGTTVDLTSTGQNTYSTNNDIRSAAAIANAGGLSDTVISALYAENGANISVSGERNVIRTYADYDKPEELERVVWAYDTADIKIDGASIIGTDTYEKSRNSNDIAIAAGTATNLTADEVNAPVTDRASVTLNYDNFTTNDGKQAVSEITGDILSAYAGQVDIAGKSADAGIKITGNLLAGNNGILNVNLGEGGVLTGRADDYGDAGANESGVGSGNDGHQSSEFFDPAFSSEIFKGGEVNLTMGDNSRWNVTGQSWITRINTAENSNAIIDLVGSNTDRNTTAHALTVYKMNGDANFNMSLDADRDVSDMLYIKNANGNYVVNVIDAVTEDDMYAARTDGGTFDGLRFATVGKDSTASFRAITYDGGFNNVEYIIGSDSYDESTENHHYNGDSLDAEKPGDSTVDDFFKNNGTPGSTTGATNGLAKASLMALPVNETNNAENDDLTNVEVNTDKTTNFKLIGVKNTEVSDGGKTILNMSRANYSNAIYMDRLNKRLGEARYINSEEDEGMWVRIRHDRIGKDDAYRSQNTMYELGYDQKQECDNGERRVGFAIDYMHGDTGYNDIAGKGEIDRYGLWLYDTWMGDKGHYADYVAKWGHLSNDFEIYNSRGEVTGDYSNNVFSVSAEYGRKKDIGNDWYFEPQVQAQLARVTGADYTTNQGTKVSVDGINSLIGRAGFRFGKDFGEEKQSTVYLKADVLHEFLGDQDIRAFDGTTSGWQTVSYENEGTWYDVGLGFAAMMSKSSYAFLDLERSFGHDNDETYQINVGMHWSF